MSHSPRRLLTALCLLAAGLATAADPAPATDPAAAPEITLRDLDVTSEKRAETVQTVERSVTVLHADDLRDAGIRTVADAIRLAPNVNLVEFSVRRLHFPFIRGIGAGQGAPAVTTYIDGVPQLSANTANLQLIEIDRIEFIRGPLGTLYGRNTLGGAINIITRQPTDTWRGSAELTLGSDDRARAQLTTAGPLIPDHLFLDAAIGYETRDGYTENPITDDPGVDDRQGTHGRLGFLWLPDPDTAVRLTLTGESNRDGGYILTPLQQLRDDPHTVTQDTDGYADRDLISPTLHLSWTGDRYTLTSITAYTWFDVEEFTDTDFSPFPLFTRYTAEEQHGLSQELRLATPDDAPWTLTDRLDLAWMLGVNLTYTDFHSDSYTEATPLAVLFLQSPVATRFWTTGHIQTFAAGVFGSATLTLDDRLDLTLGLRYDYETADAHIRDFTTDPPIPFTTFSTHESDAWDALLPHLAIAYRATDHITPYLAISRGYRPGGFNLNAPAGQTPYDMETTWSYELGLKTQWLDQRLTINTAAFYIDWDDMQLYIADPITGRFYLENAGAATSYGLELDLRYQICDYAEIFAGLGYTRATFDSFDDPLSGDAAGHRLPFAPDLTWNLGLQTTTPLATDLELYTRVELTGTGKFHYDPGNSQAENGYTLTHLRAGLRAPHWYLEAWVRNAFDTDYIPVAFQLDTDYFVAENGPPRTAGITLGLTW